MGETTGKGTVADGAGQLTAEQIRAWSGHRLDEIGGSGVGKVEGAFVDEQTGRPEWLLARMGRFGHHTLVPARDAVQGVGRVWVPYTRDQIRAAPKVPTGKPLSRDVERELLSHYGIAADAGRFAELEQRPDDAVTAKPV